MEERDPVANSPGKCEKWQFLNITCRLCSIECKSKSKHIFKKKTLEMVELCSSLRPSESDGLPTRICPSCFQSLRNSYIFRKKIETTDVLLRKKLKSFTHKQDILNIALNKAEINNLQSRIVSKDSEDISDNLLLTNRYNDLKVAGFSTADEKDPVVNADLEDMVDCCPSLEQNEERHTLQHDELEGNTKKVLLNISLPPLVPIHREENTKGNTPTHIVQEEPPPLVPFNPSTSIGPALNIDSSEPTESSCCENSAKLLKNDKELGDTSKPLFCNICMKEYKEGKKLIGHLKGHMVAKNFICSICGKKYPNPSTFQIHMRSHTGERPFKCPVCNKGFARWAGVVSHMQTHEENRPFKCDSCNQSFKILSNLERHKVLHTGALPFCCNYCGKTFSQSSNLQLHIRTYHTNERPYLCSECGKGFVSSTRLNRHMWVHTGYKPFRCKLCYKTYSNSGDLKNHESGAHGNGESDKPFACNLCDKRFFYSCRLNKHFKTHIRPHACNQCSKTFRSSIILDQHIESEHCDSSVSSNEMKVEIFEESKLI